MTTPKKRSPSRFPHVVSVSDRTWRMWQDLSGQEVPTGWARDEIIVPATLDKWQAKHGQPQEQRLPEGAEVVGPSDMGGLDMARFDNLDDPGTTITLGWPETCANCKEEVPAGEKMVMRRTRAGFRQYLHVRGICYD